MRNRRNIPLRGKPKVAVVVDGETEAWYLTMLNRNEPNAKFQIKPEIPQKNPCQINMIRYKVLLRTMTR